MPWCSLRPGVCQGCRLELFTGHARYGNWPRTPTRFGVASMAALKSPYVCGLRARPWGSSCTHLPWPLVWRSNVEAGDDLEVGGVECVEGRAQPDGGGGDQAVQDSNLVAEPVSKNEPDAAPESPASPHCVAPLDPALPGSAPSRRSPSCPRPTGVLSKSPPPGQVLRVHPCKRTRPRLIMRARSTLSMVAGLSRPSRRTSRCLSIDRIWLRRATESV